MARGAHIADWSEREAGEQIAAARRAIPDAVVDKAIRAYESLPEGSGIHERMRAAIFAIQRKPQQQPAQPQQRPGNGEIK